jgi:hypothetical protein
MLNTIQVRKIMRQFGKEVIYTNKLVNEKFRTVKCYYNGSENDKKLVKLLLELNGQVRVNTNRVTLGYFNSFDAINVTCKFEK